MNTMKDVRIKLQIRYSMAMVLIQEFVCMKAKLAMKNSSMLSMPKIQLIEQMRR